MSRRKAPWKKVVVVLAVLAVLGALAGVAGIFGMFWWYGRGIAQFDEEGLANYRPPQVTRIYSRDDELIGEIYTQRRTFVRYEDIPPHVENAFLAAEDADFYKHEGMDYLGMVRALIINLKAGQIKQGASTITQQVVKNFMLSPERSLERKVQELILARRLEKAFTKKEILELYLNEIYLGHGRYGIEEASRFYFGKSVREVNLGQAALLATLPKAPGRDSPFQNYDRAKRRQIYVLQQMVEHGFAKPEDAQPFEKAPLELSTPEERPKVIGGADEFVDLVRAELVERYGAEALDTLGARVTATVSLPLQREATAAVSQGLKAVDGRHGYGRRRKPASDEEREAALAKGRKAAFSPGAIVPAVVVERPEGVELPESGFAARVGDRDVFVRVPEGSRYDDPELPLSEQFVPGGVLDVRVEEVQATQGEGELPSGWSEARPASGPEAMVVVTDVQSGEVLAMVGGSHYERGGFNRVTRAARQPGSSFKPFVYGAAIASQSFTPATIVSDSPEIYEKWKPTNFSRDVYLGDVRLRVALTKSINTIAIKLADTIGVEAVIDFARAAGIASELPANLSLALGTGEVVPFELMRGYLTLARGGERIEPVLIREIELPSGERWTPELETTRALPQDVAFVLTSMMKSVVDEGTGARARKLGRPAAGKTGTSGDFHDAWFAGFTPQRVAVAWVGFDRPRRMRGETGGKAAVPIWLQTMQKAHEDLPVLGFTPPPIVEVRRIDAQSGLLAPTGEAAETYQGEAIEEYFVAGTAPIEEAVPAALPADDVLLGLYEDEPAQGEADEQDLDPHDETPDGATSGSAPSEDEPSLPSLDDDRL